MLKLILRAVSGWLRARQAYPRPKWHVIWKTVSPRPLEPHFRRKLIVHRRNENCKPLAWERRDIVYEIDATRIAQIWGHVFSDTSIWKERKEYLVLLVEGVVVDERNKWLLAHEPSQIAEEGRLANARVAQDSEPLP